MSGDCPICGVRYAEHMAGCDAIRARVAALVAAGEALAEFIDTNSSGLNYNATVAALGEWRRVSGGQQ